jgi:hypothetical protein
MSDDQVTIAGPADVQFQRGHLQIQRVLECGQRVWRPDFAHASAMCLQVKTTWRHMPVIGTRALC